VALHRGIQRTQAKFRKRPAPSLSPLNFCGSNKWRCSADNIVPPAFSDQVQNTEYAGGR
jgi:hypothetical protein